MGHFDNIHSQSWNSQCELQDISYYSPQIAHSSKSAPPIKTKQEEDSFELTEQQHKFIELLHLRPSLWDPGHKNFSNRDLKRDGWKEIGNSTHMTGDEAKAMYKTLRAKFTRNNNKLKPSGSGRGPKGKQSVHKKAFMNKLSFLSATNVTRSGSGNYQEEEEIVLQTSSESEGECEQKTQVKNLKKLYTPPPPKKVKEDYTKKIFNMLETPEDEENIFGHYVGVTLKALSPSVRESTKIKIMTLLSEGKSLEQKIWNPLDG